ncbi:MAG: hypothetical protein ACK4OP_01535 [Gemmobacter sp.]
MAETLKCPFGDDCDLTVAWMAGQAEARASLSDRIVELKTQIGFARIDADNQRARAEAAEIDIQVLRAERDEALAELARLRGKLAAQFAAPTAEP